MTQVTTGLNEIIASADSASANPELSIPDVRNARAEVARAITQCIRTSGLKQTEAAALLQTNQGKISAIMRGQLRHFSYERLQRYLSVLTVGA